MRGDFSRQTFDPRKHYTGVLMQQGRVQVDADWNEQQAIVDHHLRSRTVDVVGATGAPRAHAGFSIVPANGGLTIGAGHYYVDGVLCENDADAAIAAQAYLPGFTLPTTDGLYLVYLEAWQRHVSALEDPAIRETALGGPDTATRTRTIWQVRLLAVAEPSGGATCGSAFPEWTAHLSQHVIGEADGGRLSAQTGPADATTSPCVLPPTAGYRGLENQLYRVEIHRGGARAEARFKWSRNNASDASAVLGTSGSDVTVDDIGKDETRAFELQQWVEATDDRLELADQHGQLLLVADVNPATRVVRVDGAAPALDPERHPTLRRWDQRGATASADGVALSGDWLDLEEGVQVRFSDGQYKAGDYWIVPARTAVSADTGGVEWPVDGQGQPIAQLPHGTPHRFARLALVRLSAGAFSAVPGGDCRIEFPPLTAIEARDVAYNDGTCALGAHTVQQALDALCQRQGGVCSRDVHPGEDVAAAFAALPDAADAQICFAAGTYDLPAPVEIRSKGHLRISGCGAGTKLVCATAEAALVFEDCSSVTVEHLAVEAGRTGAGKPGLANLTGGLTFVNCASVTVDHVRARCASGGARAAACLTIRMPDPPAGALPVGQARVMHSHFDTGHMQTGVLIVNVARAQVEDNTLAVVPKPSLNVLRGDPRYRAALERQLVANLTPGNATGSPPSGTNATVTVAGHSVHFLTDPQLVHGTGTVNDWQRAVDAMAPQVDSPAALKAVIDGLARRLVLTGTIGSALPRFSAVVSALFAQDLSAAGQGIAIGGRAGRDIRIVDNTLDGVIQGVHVGVSHQEAAQSAPDRAELVLISGNTVRVVLPSSATRERHGIFVGNAGSLIVDDNYITVQRVARTVGLRVEAIRAFGHFGPRAIVRQNHISGATVGIRFEPIGPGLARPQWIVTDNVASGAAQVVEVPAAVRARIRGLADNYA